MRVAVDNSGKTQMRLTTAPAAASPVVVSQPQPAKSANPLAANPFAEAPAASVASDPWPGTYGDEQMVLELKAIGNGAYEGSILFKGQKFPVTARADGNQLNGEFKSNAAVFDFTATRDGTTVMLSSGGKTYQLKKQGASPLGSDSRPTQAPLPAKH